MNGVYLLGGFYGVSDGVGSIYRFRGQQLREHTTRLGRIVVGSMILYAQIGSLPLTVAAITLSSWVGLGIAIVAEWRRLRHE